MRDKEIVDANMIDQDQKRNRTNGMEGEEIKENMGEEANPIQLSRSKIGRAHV